MAQDKQNNIIAEINELFLNKFPGSTSGNNEDIISHEESRFAKFDQTNPTGNLETVSCSECSHLPMLGQ